MKAMTRVWWVLACVAVMAGAAVVAQVDQDPTNAVKILPKNYKLTFENDYVQVVRVHFDPHEFIPEHQHGMFRGIYVYLNDSGPLIYNHIVGFQGSRRRPFYPAGTFHAATRSAETHTIENPTDRPVEFLRVMYKTDPAGARVGGDFTWQRTYARLGQVLGENNETVQFDSAQARITRVIVGPGKTLTITPGVSAASTADRGGPPPAGLPGGPAGAPPAPAPAAAKPDVKPAPVLLIALSPADFKGMKLGLGDTRWVPANQPNQMLDNAGSKTEAELLRIDFPSRPLTKDEIDAGTKSYYESMDRTREAIKNKTRPARGNPDPLN